MITGKYPSLRLRRTRKYNWSRKLVQENYLSSNDLIYPIFLVEGKNKKQLIKSMPGVYRYSIDRLGMIINNVIKNKIPMVALFPSTPNKKKDKLEGIMNVDKSNFRQSNTVFIIISVVLLFALFLWLLPKLGINLLSLFQKIVPLISTLRGILPF